eukprot:1195683-Prorocentrum_minimum.AAC.12
MSNRRKKPLWSVAFLFLLRQQPSSDSCNALSFAVSESEKRLIKKCKDLNSEIIANAAKVQTALKLSEEDQSTIQALKKEIEKAWKMVDGSHEKEARAKETIQQLKLEIANLSRLVEQGAGLSLGQEQTVRRTVSSDHFTPWMGNHNRTHIIWDRCMVTGLNIFPISLLLS